MTQLVLPLGSAPPEASGLAARRPRPVTLPPLPDSGAILAAPMFAPDRTPVQAGAGPNAGGSMDSYAVVGVAVGRSTASAVLSGPGEGAQTVLKRGEQVKGWRLVAVSPTKAVFEREGVQRSLTVGAPAAAAAAAASDESDGDTETEEPDQ